MGDSQGRLLPWPNDRVGYSYGINGILGWAEGGRDSGCIDDAYDAIVIHGSMSC